MGPHLYEINRTLHVKEFLVASHDLTHNNTVTYFTYNLVLSGPTLLRDNSYFTCGTIFGGTDHLTDNTVIISCLGVAPDFILKTFRQLVHSFVHSGISILIVHIQFPLVWAHTTKR